MSLDSNRSTIRARRSHDISSGLSRGLLPSWIFSVWFHVLILIAAAFGLRSCTGQGNRGEADVEWNTVGLVMRTSVTEAPPHDATSSETDDEVSDAEESAVTEMETPTPPPIQPETTLANTLPSELPPVIGPGASMPNFSSADSVEIEENRVSNAPAAPSGLARGETEFLNIRSSGSSFVYVIDVSGSMATPPTAIRSAKAELLGSLATLNSDQKFHVIFYNERPFVMNLKGRRSDQMYQATDINRTMARQQIAAVEPALGTHPMPALRIALDLEPDVIFFLTDAEQSALSARELAEVKRLNRDRSRIHAIEFGKGDRLGKASAMQRLAAQNGGAYQYHDVNRFEN